MVGSRVYVGGLPYGTNERDLQRFFRGYGHMREVLIKSGYGFVEFDDQRDADDAVYELNGKKLLGERVTVERARGIPRGRDQWTGGRSGGRGRDHRTDDRYGPPTRTNYRVIVQNLSTRVSWQDLKDYMRQAGEVTYADAHKQHRNEGIVEFANHTDLKNALEKLDDTELNGRRIRLTEDKSSGNSRRRSRSDSHSKSRSKSYSRSRSRGRSRSRSRSEKRSRSKSPRSKSRSPRSRSGSVVKSKRSVSRENSKDRRSRSHHRSQSRHSRSEHSRSASPIKQKKSDARDSRSRSRSPRFRSQSPHPRSPNGNDRHSRSRSRSRSN